MSAHLVHVHSYRYKRLTEDYKLAPAAASQPTWLKYAENNYEQSVAFKKEAAKNAIAVAMSILQSSIAINVKDKPKAVYTTSKLSRNALVLTPHSPTIKVCKKDEKPPARCAEVVVTQDKDHRYFLSPYCSTDHIVAFWYVGNTDDEDEANVDVVKETINVVVGKVHWDVIIPRLKNKKAIQLGTELKLFQEPQEKEHAPRRAIPFMAPAAAKKRARTS